MEIKGVEREDRRQVGGGDGLQLGVLLAAAVALQFDLGLVDEPVGAGGVAYPVFLA